MKTSAITRPLKSHSVTVAIAAFNEEKNLETLLLALHQTFQQLGFSLPVLIIDDGSTDNSLITLRCLQKQYAFLQVLAHPQCQGLTAVLKTMIAYSTTDWIYLSGGDLESDIETDLPLLLESCTAGVDAVAGWRQHRQDGKGLASKMANWACRLSFGLQIHDMNWIKLIRLDLLAALPLERTTHRYLLPVLAGWGYRVIEVPTVWHSRQAGQSKFGHKRLWTSSIAFLKLWLWFQFQGRRLAPSAK